MTRITTTRIAPRTRSELAELKELIAPAATALLLPAEIERLQQMLAANRRHGRSISGLHAARCQYRLEDSGQQSVDGIVESSRHATRLVNELDRCTNAERPAARTRARCFAVARLRLRFALLRLNSLALAIRSQTTMA